MNNMIQLLLLLGTFGPIMGKMVHQFPLPRDFPYEVVSLDYPNLMEMVDGNTIEWNITVENDAKLKLVCMDIRMVGKTPIDPNNCQDAYLSIEDGRGLQKLCPKSLSKYFIYVTDGPNIMINLHISSKATGAIACILLNTGEPAPEEIIKLDPNGSERLINVEGNDQNPLPLLDSLWVFESPAGTRMSFNCYDVSVEEQKPICGWNSLKFNNGETEEEFCGQSTNLVWFSKGNKAKLRLQLDIHGLGRLKCTVKAIAGP